MNLHFEVMEQQQRKVLDALGRILAASDFYLAGGTAVALRLGHRRSLDLDLFTRARIADGLKFAADLRRHGLNVETRAVSPGTLHANVDGVLVSFLEYDYPLLSQSEVLPSGAKLAQADDLACMKLSAAAQRGSRKDFIDLYGIGRQQINLADMLALYQRKYGVDDIAHVLCGLAFFDDADKEPMPEMLWQVQWNEVRKTVMSWLAGIVA